MENNKLVFTADVARYLLKKGHIITDIKPDKNYPCKEKTVFVFDANVEDFEKDYSEAMKKYYGDRDTDKEDTDVKPKRASITDTN